MKNAVRTYERKRIWAIIVALMATLLPATAQDYRFEAGGGLGISGYLGDVNQSNVTRDSRVNCCSAISSTSGLR